MGRISSFTIFVLELQGGYYWVGRTRDLDATLTKHMAGTESEWTKIHPPVRILETRSSINPYDEDALTKELMGKHGIEKVRGASYSTTKLDLVQTTSLQREILAAQGRPIGSPEPAGPTDCTIL